MENTRNKTKHKSTKKTNSDIQNNPKPSFKTNNKPKNQALKIYQLNVNGIQNSLVELHPQLKEQNIDIALIQETKLHPDAKDPIIPDYTAYRLDRPIKDKDNKTKSKKKITVNKTKNKRTLKSPRQKLTKSKINGGGLVTFIKNDISFTPITSPKLTDKSHIESQSISISLSKNEKLTLTNLYIPPRNSTVSQEPDNNHITSLLTQLTATKNSLIAGDINAHSSLWYSPFSDHRGNLVADLIQNSEHTILNQKEHTRSSANQAQQPTSPDITTISSNLSDKANWKLSTTPLRSDHLPIIITIKTKNNF